MGKSKKKNSKRVNSLASEEGKTRSKRCEVETTNSKSNQKDVSKNQVEDKIECKKSITEGTHLSINDETENNKLDSKEKKESKTKKESVNQQIIESLNKNKNNFYTTESIYKPTNQSNSSSKHEEQSYCTLSQGQSHNKNSTFEKTQNKNLNVCGNDKLPTEVGQCNLVEIEQDLFNLPNDISLACCVAENFEMESDICIQFRRFFGDIDKLIEQNLKMGEVGLVNRHNQNAFYLITKKCISNKPKIKTINQAFKSLFNKMKEMDLTKLAIAKINFEEEGYDWSIMIKCITNVFAGSGVHIRVCVPSKKSYEPSEDSFNGNKETQNESEVSAFDNKSNIIADTNSNQQYDTNKKKKGKKNKGQQSEDNNKNTELNNTFKSTSFANRKSGTFIESKHSQSTDSNTGQGFKKDGCKKKIPNNKNAIKNQNNKSLLSDECQSISEDKMDILEEIDQNLFELSDEFSLAHCVAEDLRMGAGIAIEFKRIFGGVGKLMDQNLKVGDVGIIKRHNKYVFYLITKKNSSGKPTMRTMEMALRSLVVLMKNLKLMKLGIPKIGCGLDGLDWDDVKSLIIQEFFGSGIHIIVCIPSKLLDCKVPPPLKVFITSKNLWEMDAETVIVMLINLEQVCKQNWSDNVVDKVNSRYPFKENLLKDVKQIELSPGEIRNYCVNGENLICIFYLQKEFYSSLELAFKKILRLSKYYMYLAIQSGSTVDNYEHIAWIVLILRSISSNQRCELWLCGDVNQIDNVIQYDQYCRNVRYSINRHSQYYSTSQVINEHNNDRHSFSPREKFNHSGRSSLSLQPMYSCSPFKTSLLPPKEKKND